DFVAGLGRVAARARRRVRGPGRPRPKGASATPRRKPGRRAGPQGRGRLMRLTMLAAAALVACGTPTPRPIALNEDACAYCRMTISDPRFGGEIVTRTGRVETFDSIECLASWVSATDASSIASIYVMDFDRPGRLVNATAAGFLRDFPVRGPMGH